MAKNWGAVTNPDTGQTIALVAASGPRHLTLMDWAGDGSHLQSVERLNLSPHGSAEMVNYLVLADSLEEARRYAILGSK